MAGDELNAEPVDDFNLSPHARFEMARRGLSEELVRFVLRTPDQRESIRPGRDVLPSIVAGDGTDQPQLVRVFVDIDRRPAVVVTAYRTSRISRYWRSTP